MAATEQDHARARAAYFLRDVGDGVEPLVQVYRFGHVDYVGAVFIDPVTDRFFVFWSDGVANDFCQEVRDADDADEFLEDLAAAVAREDSTFTEAEFAKWADR